MMSSRPLGACLSKTPWSTLIAGAALVLSVINYADQRSNAAQTQKIRERQNEQDYMAAAAMRQPVLRYATLRGHDADAQYDSITFHGDSVAIFVSTVRITGTIPVYNSSEWLARPIALVSCDWPTQEEKLRQLLLDPTAKPAIKVDSTYGGAYTLCPGETTYLNINHTSHLTDDSGRIGFHLLLLYENAERKLYDSYATLIFASSWIRNSLPKIPRPTKAVRDSMAKSFLGKRYQLPPGSVIVSRPMADLHVYSAAEAERVRLKLDAARASGEESKKRIHD